MEDALCRGLNANEGFWLTVNKSSSPLCLMARLRSDADLTESMLEAALAECRMKHPYLGVCVDKTAKELRSAAVALPLSCQSVNSCSSDSIRAIAREQLLAGIDISQTLVRAHLIMSSDASWLLLLGDHLAFDGKSFVAWLTDLLSGAAGVRIASQIPHPFTDWTARVPLVQLPPFAATATLSLALLAAPPDLSDAPNVEDVVVTLDEDVFIALKAETKAAGTKLNGPLMTAFGAAVIDAIRRQQPELSPPFPVRGMCAVDVRSHVFPPLPPDYVCSAAGLVPCALKLEPGEDLWAVAALSTKSLVADVAAGEAFRMQSIFTRGAFAELGPLFAGPFLWSNIGHFEVPAGPRSCGSSLDGSRKQPIVVRPLR